MDPETSSRGQCMLLMLPAELRNTIYTHLLLQPTTASSPPSHPPSPSTSSRRRFCANILQTCKQINREATSILYAGNLFAAHCSLLAALPSLLLTTYPNRTTLPPVLLPRPLSLIRRYSIQIRLDTDPGFDRSKLRESFSGVDELEVRVSQAMYGGCDFSVLELFDEVRGVGQARVIGSIGDGKYAAWLEAAMMRDPGDIVKQYTSVGGDESAAWNSWAHGNR